SLTTEAQEKLTNISCASRLLFVLFFLFLFRLLALFCLCLFSTLGLLYFKLAAEQFDDCEICSIALAVAEFDDAAGAAVAVGKTRCDRVEDLFCDRVAKQIRLDLAARVQVIALAERDHLLGERPDFLGFGKRRHEAAVVEEVCHEVPQQRTPVRSVAA